MCLYLVTKPLSSRNVTYIEIIIYFYINILYNHNLLSKYMEFVSNANNKT